MLLNISTLDGYPPGGQRQGPRRTVDEGVPHREQNQIKSINSSPPQNTEQVASRMSVQWQPYVSHFSSFWLGCLLKLILSPFHHWIYWVMSKCGKRRSRKQVVLVNSASVNKESFADLMVYWTSPEILDLKSVTGEDLVLNFWGVDRCGLCVGGRSKWIFGDQTDYERGEAGQIATCFHLLGQTGKVDFSVSRVFRS